MDKYWKLEEEQSAMMEDGFDREKGWKWEIKRLGIFWDWEELEIMGTTPSYK